MLLSYRYGFKRYLKFYNKITFLPMTSPVFVIDNYFLDINLTHYLIQLIPFLFEQAPYFIKKKNRKEKKRERFNHKQTKWNQDS